jgi:hypothetical protein
MLTGIGVGLKLNFCHGGEIQWALENDDVDENLVEDVEEGTCPSMVLYRLFYFFTNDNAPKGLPSGERPIELSKREDRLMQEIYSLRKELAEARK